MLFTKMIVALRSRVRYFRYVCRHPSRNNLTFSQAMTEALLLNPRRHPVMMGPEELSRYFAYSANRSKQRRWLKM